MRPRSERSERSTFVLRIDYVLITYLLLSLLLARYVRGTCFALAWCLHGSCVAFSTHFCVCLYYVCQVFSMCLRVSSNFHLIALPVPLSVRFMFLVFFWCCFRCVFRCGFFRSWRRLVAQKEPLLSPSWDPKWSQNRSKVVLKSPATAKVKIFKFPLFYNTFAAPWGAQVGSKSCSRLF